jgi:hypothetical protein
VPRVRGLHLQALQPLEAGLPRRPVVDNRVQDRPALVQQQVAAEQGAFCGQDRYRPLGMPRNVNHLRVEAVLTEIVSVLKVQVGAASLRFAKPEEDRGHSSDEEVAALSVPEDVASFEHPGIVAVHGDPGAEPAVQIGGIARMVEIPVCEDDELQIAGLAARVLQLPLDLLALVRRPGVNEDEPTISYDDVAVDAAESEWQPETDGPDLWLHMPSDQRSLQSVHHLVSCSAM